MKAISAATILGAITVLGAASAAHAVSYPDGAGMDFTWQNAEDDNGYFNMPVASPLSNLIFFPQSSFLAEADNVQPTDSVTDQLRMDLSANSGLYFESVSFLARGNYEILASQIGDASVQAIGDVTLTALVGQPLDPGLDHATYNFFADQPTAGSVLWDETLLVTIPLSKEVSALHIEANQTNIAIAADGSSSILTNFQIIGIELGMAIPEPASISLLLLGGLTLARRHRR